MKISEAANADSGVVGTMREGVLAQKFLLKGKDGSPNNYLLNVGRTGTGGWAAPRHKHNFDQIRYVLKGNYPYGKDQVMPEGTVAYFPESVYYGPQDRPEGLEMMVCQFGGASGQGYLSVTQREAANDRLKKKGEFKGGLFTWRDEEGNQHTQDGFEACFEEAMGRKLAYAPPRFGDVILMDPANFSWIADAHQAGVAHKWLGSFTERELRVGLTQIAAGATFRAGEQPALEVMFLSRGSVTVQGRTYGRHTAFELLPEDPHLEVTAAGEAEFLRLIMPKF
ncbi:hypothetical protein NON00_07910 [Roseomonas sp. GC11]|uniref:hypothetical protein n=1 Tax=Roseomonas sp. GC11 TaxID=2950546 RepID=UPI00210E20F9|nr:hypothetical protein [Roseomonas sp. GC11]MCQ4159851.1 hypothetical protein [Roseomonas sp. GC11]